MLSDSSRRPMNSIVPARGLRLPLMTMPREDLPAPCSPTRAWIREG